MHPLPKKPRLRRRILITLGLCLLLGILGTIGAGYILARPANRPVGPPPADLGAVDVSIHSTSGTTLAGWFVPGRPGAGGILLLHGIHADRRVLVGRAGFLHRAGYSVLMIDFQAHGESPGKHITFGYLESRDVEAAAAELGRRLPGEPLAAIGISMGGAAIVLAQHRLPFQAVVLESVYPPQINRLSRLRRKGPGGKAGGLLAPLILVQLHPRLGIWPRQLRPIEHVADLGVPVLMMSGSQDNHPTPAEARALFERAREPKEFWEVPGAGHVDLHEVAPVEYERRVGAFLDRYLH